MNKQHLHSTTTIQLHLTTADYQRICQDPASEFFLNKTTQIYARGLQKERYTVLSNNSDSRPSNFLFQIARGSGATLSECTFFKKAHVTRKTSSRQDPPAPCSKQQEARGLHPWMYVFFLQKAHTTRRSQEALHGFTQESTRTTLVPTWQDLKKQDEASRAQP